MFKQYDFRNTTSVIETTEERAKLENWIPGGAARWVRLSYEAMKGTSRISTLGVESAISTLSFQHQRFFISILFFGAGSRLGCLF